MVPADTLNQIRERFQFLEAKMAGGAEADEIAALAKEYADLRPVVAEIEAYQAMITEMRRVYLSRPAGLAAVESEQGWSEEAYEEAEKKIAKLALKRIKHLNKNIFKSDGFGSRLDKEFLIFIAVLKHLSTDAGNDEAVAAEENWATNVIITHRHKKKEHEVFVLT